MACACGICYVEHACFCLFVCFLHLVTLLHELLTIIVNLRGVILTFFFTLNVWVSLLDFHVEEALDWPGVYLLPGQVSGVAVDPQNNLVIFHRGDHVWDGK